MGTRIHDPETRLPDSLSPTTLQFLELLARSAFRGDIEKSYASRLAMATDNSVYQVVPQAVLYPRSADDIAVMLSGPGARVRDLEFLPSRRRYRHQWSILGRRHYRRSLAPYEPDHGN
jgi:hypothetical protein